MPRFGASKAQLRMWALLTIAFMIVGVSSGIAIVRISSERYTHDYRAELMNLANVVASSIDPGGHAALKTPEDMKSAGYLSAVRALAEVKRKVPEIRYIYTLRKGAKDYEFVLDPTPPGDHDQDGVDDKSYLGDPYPEISMTAKTAYEQGIAMVDEEPATDRWGTFISGYAPVKDAKGHVVAILGIDRLANDLVEHTNDIRNAVIIGFLLVTGMGGFFGWAFTRRMSNSPDNPGWSRYLTGSNRIFRANILEVVLGSLALIAFLGGAQNVVTIQRLSSEISSGQARISRLRKIRTALDAEVANRGDANAVVDRIRSMTQQYDIAWLYNAIEQVDLTSGIENIEASLRALRNQSDREMDLVDRQQGAAERDLGHQYQDIELLVIVSALLALGTLVLARRANIHQQDLIAARTDSEWHQVAYRQVVENLPIGLYMYANGAITFSNDTWDAQCFRTPGQDRVAALAAVVPEQDATALLETLMSAQVSQAGFEHQFRIVPPTGEPIILESRGVPLFNSDGEFECLLGFTLDVSQRVKVQDLLRGKNREVQSKNRMLSRAVAELEENFEAMVQTLVKAVEAKDIYTAGHSERVMQYSLRIGDRLKLSPQEMKILQMGTLVHDVGKIGIPDEVLNKPTKLSESERSLIREHAENGARMVEGIPIFQDCIPIIRWHHERLDGSGYPNNLQAKDIPLLVRIASAADVFDALTSDRAYRTAMTPTGACEVLEKMVQNQELDPEIVSILTDIVEKEGILWFNEPEQAA
jgi:HD-GYP domain-containing protein (c-di-GMP phosphodiesterase class II)